MPVRARVLASFEPLRVLSGVGSFLPRDLQGIRQAVDRLGVTEWAVMVENLALPTEAESELTAAGVRCVRIGDALVVLATNLDDPPWTPRVPDVYTALKKALSAHNAPALNLVWGGRVLPLSQRAHIMGIVNVTPDSFSDGGRFFDAAAAVEHGLALVEEGADLLDVGGESTRPGADPVDARDEAARVVPVIEALAAKTGVPISVDTTKASVAAAALDAGASIVNDVSAGRADPEMFSLVADRRVPIVLMHMLGDPRTMQRDPTYRDVVGEVYGFLADRADAAVAAGVDPARILIDPGFGFGKTREHNLVLLRRLREFRCLGYPVLAGTSRKSFIGQTLDVGVDERTEGTAATVAMAVVAGAAVIRVHDVLPMRRVAGMVEAILRASAGEAGRRET